MPLTSDVDLELASAGGYSSKYRGTETDVDPLATGREGGVGVGGGSTTAPETARSAEEC